MTLFEYYCCGVANKFVGIPLDLYTMLCWVSDDNRRVVQWGIGTQVRKYLAVTI